MDEFLIPTAEGSGGLLFYDRTPLDSSEAIESCWVRITVDHHLSAASPVWAGYTAGHPLQLFEEMASKWAGWPGELIWESTEGELNLKCTHDKRGHISIRAELRSGQMPANWMVSATITVEAGQLEGIAKRAALFFGCEWEVFQ